MNIGVKGIQALLFLAALTLISFLAAPSIPLVNTVIMGLLLGILVGNVQPLPVESSKHISSYASRILEWAIVFLAFSIDYKEWIGIGYQGILLVVFMITSILIISKWLSKLFKCNSSTSWLIAFGTAICGSSAIAAMAPVVSENKEDVGISLAVVNLMGTIGMIFLPILLIFLETPENELGLILGSSLHSVGNVAGASYSLGNEIGETAITIKMARVAMLSPVLLIFSYLSSRKTSISNGSKFKLPWYLLAFIGITVVNSMITFPDAVVLNLDLIGKILLTAAMVGIGYGIKFRSLVSSGKKGLMYGLVLFLIQLEIVTALMQLLY